MNPEESGATHGYIVSRPMMTLVGSLQSLPITIYNSSTLRLNFFITHICPHYSESAIECQTELTCGCLTAIALTFARRFPTRKCTRHPRPP
jgi:hypothetical protein